MNRSDRTAVSSGRVLQSAAFETLEARQLMAVDRVIPITVMPSASISLSSREVSRADAVINWNATTLKAVWNDGTPPTAAARVMAMSSVAVSNAISGTTRFGVSYPVPGLTARAARGASAEAAAIAAADTVLTALFPAQKPMFDAEYQATLARVHRGAAMERGIAWGDAVGKAVLKWRATDGWDAPTTYTPGPPGGTPGVYQLTPGTTSALAPEWGRVTPWGITDPAAFLPPPPPALDSAEYAADLNETKALGGTTSTIRTEDQAAFGHFWADVPGASATPPGHWNEIAENVSLRRGLSMEENARLFMTLNTGLADAAICCWDAKYRYNFWRPITAIRNADVDGNPATEADPTWTPLWNTPNFPSYTSGHSTFSGAADSILTAAFGRNVRFTIGSDDMPGYTRTFRSFSAAADEAGRSRVVGGIHFEFDNQAGLASGRALGRFIAARFLRNGRGSDVGGGRGDEGRDDKANRGRDWSTGEPFLDVLTGVLNRGTLFGGDRHILD